jgi:hypothetical protein
MLGLALLASCDPGGPSKPEPSAVEVVLSDQRAAPSVAPLRYAVVWTLAQDEFVVTDDGPVGSPEERPLAKLELPSQATLQRLSPVEPLALSTRPSDELARAYRPRVVVYEDVDESADFAPNLRQSAGPDRVLGIDQDDRGIAALLDVEAALEALPMESQSFYYFATGGRFSAFLSVLSGTPLEPVSWSPNLGIVLDDTDYGALSLECLRPSFLPKLADTTIELGTGVDPALCGLFASSCHTSDLNVLPAPDFASAMSDGFERTARCGRRDGLQALTIKERHATCEECLCSNEMGSSVFVADAAQLPAWWPCGSQVPFCAGEELVSLDTACELADP